MVDTLKVLEEIEQIHPYQYVDEYTNSIST